jgi:enoyl-CoA hydratase/carnithine racemase
MHLETMFCTREGPVATLVLNRPGVLNCANEQWARDLNVIADDLAARSDLRVVVLRGAGRAFCSGIDITALSQGETGMSFFRNWETGLRKLESMDAVVLAAVQSHCIGGGLQIALACDLRIATDDARFGITAVREGIIPGMGMWRVARHAGLGRTKRLALAADVIDAQTAHAWGLVDWVVPADALDAKVTELVERILSTAPTSTRLTKKLTNTAFEMSFAEFAELYYEYQRQAISSPEHKAIMAEHREARRSRTTTR